MKTRWLISIAVSALLCTGCLDYEQILTINKDGSGTITMRYAIDKAYLQQMKAMAADAQAMAGEQAEEISTIDQVFDKENIKAQLAANSWGIAITDYSMTETDKAQIWSMSFSFKDINNLWHVYGLIGTDEDTDTTGEGTPPAIYRRQDAGTWLYELPLGDANATGEEQAVPADDMPTSDDNTEEDSDEFSEMTPEQMKEMGMSDSMIQAMQQLQKMANTMVKQMAKHELRFVTTFPGKIVESNATKVEGNTATWVIPLTQLEKAAPTLRAVIKP